MWRQNCKLCPSLFPSPGLGERGVSRLLLKQTFGERKSLEKGEKTWQTRVVNFFA
jgi:hypothetical protein